MSATNRPSDNEATMPTTGTTSEVALSIVIDATPSEVWAVLADFGRVAIWNPSVKTSHLTSTASEGTGISRQCKLSPMGTVQERVVEWEPDRVLGIEIYENDGLPGFRSGRARLVIDELSPSSTRVTMTMQYTVGLGVIGAAANAIGMRRVFTRSLTQLLAGLKHHVETGRPVDDDAELDLDAVAVA